MRIPSRLFSMDKNHSGNNHLCMHLLIGFWIASCTLSEVCTICYWDGGGHDSGDWQHIRKQEWWEQSRKIMAKISLTMKWVQGRRGLWYWSWGQRQPRGPLQWSVVDTVDDWHLIMSYMHYEIILWTIYGLLKISDPSQITVAQKTVPMFGCFILFDL